MAAGFQIRVNYSQNTPGVGSGTRSQFLLSHGAGRTVLKVRRGRAVYRQGDPSDSAFLLEEGRVLMNVVSSQGKEAIVGVISPGDLFGEECIVDESTRVTSAIALEPLTLLRIERQDFRYAVRNSPEFCDRLLNQMFRRRRQAEESLADHVFCSSELRLIRVLLTLAEQSTGYRLRTLPRVSQTTLAAMVGTTRSRISFFLNKFRATGMIEYDQGIRVDTARLSAALNQ